jgi:signal peptide peptidase SppA
MPRRWRESLKNREALAIRADIDILAMLCDAPPPSEIRGELGILFVRGPIDHHASFGDSYERIAEAFHELNDDDSVKAIAMIVDSPGGLVSGLNSTVRALRKAKSKPVYAIADEMATSAAYAIALIADEIICSPSAVVGSCGVISTMCSQARADEKMGLDFVTITSGERKADGHPHMPIDEGAIAAEEGRVDELAEQFFDLVKEARGLKPDYVRSLEAGIFLGADALAAGLVDEVLDVDEALEAIATVHGLNISLAQPGTSGNGGTTPPEASMLSAKAKIAKLTAEMAASPSRKRRTALAGQITKLMAAIPRADTTKKWEKHESEEETTSDEDEEEEEEEGGNETDREEESDEPEKKDEKKDEESAESEDDEKKAESDDKDDMPEKKEKKAAKAIRSSARLAALEAEVSTLRKRAADAEAVAAKNSREATLASALRSKRISPAEAASLAKKSSDYVAAFLEARPKSIVLTPEEALRPLPKGSAAIARKEGGAPEAGVELTPEQDAMLAQITDEKLRAQVLTNWTAKVNGAAR